MTREKGHGIIRALGFTVLGFMTIKGKATSLDIAHLAGVSQPTVSRALRGSPMVNEETRRRIQAIAEQLNYKVDKNASNLRTQHSGTLDAGTLGIAMGYAYQDSPGQSNSWRSWGYDPDGLIQGSTIQSRITDSVREGFSTTLEFRLGGDHRGSFDLYYSTFDVATQQRGIEIGLGRGDYLGGTLVSYDLVTRASWTSRSATRSSPAGSRTSASCSRRQT